MILIVMIQNSKKTSILPPGFIISSVELNFAVNHSGGFNIGHFLSRKCFSTQGMYSTCGTRRGNPLRTIAILYSLSSSFSREGVGGTWIVFLCTKYLVYASDANDLLYSTLLLRSPNEKLRFNIYWSPFFFDIIFVRSKKDSVPSSQWLGFGFKKKSSVELNFAVNNSGRVMLRSWVVFTVLRVSSFPEQQIVLDNNSSGAIVYKLVPRGTILYDISSSLHHAWSLNPRLLHLIIRSIITSYTRISPSYLCLLYGRPT